MTRYAHDERLVMTLDAGGTSFRFAAMRAGKAATEIITLPAHADDLGRSLANIVEGFSQVRAQCPAPPVAISFAFPGPADYPNGIIINPPNLPAFRDVALGPMLAGKFNLPVFINNDGDLFAFGEAMAGLLPHVNGLLKKAGSPRRYKNLLGVTLGTGFGGGISRNGELYAGDNSDAGEVWLLRNKLHPEWNAEESVSIRGVKRVYAEKAGISSEQTPEPKEIFEVGTGVKSGNRAAAEEAFRQLGEVAGDAIAQALTLLDGLVVIGGGLANAWPLFLPALVAELNGSYSSPDGQKIRKLASIAFNLEGPVQLRQFVQGDAREIAVPGSQRTVKYDPLRRIGVGVSRLGTTEAIAIGAYAFALGKLINQ